MTVVGLKSPGQDPNRKMVDKISPGNTLYEVWYNKNN